MPATDVATILPYSDDTIRRWDKEVLEEQFGKVDLSKVKYILIDEKSIGRGHNYITLVLDAETGELLYMGKGKSADSLKPFFEKMPESVRKQIVVACMDRANALNILIYYFFDDICSEFCRQSGSPHYIWHCLSALNLSYQTQCQPA